MRVPVPLQTLLSHVSNREGQQAPSPSSPGLSLGLEKGSDSKKLLSNKALCASDAFIAILIRIKL